MTAKLTGNFLATARCLIFNDGNGIAWTFNSLTNTLEADYSGAGSAGSANPSATIGLTAVDGNASTWMTSDSAPALSQAIVPTWSGLHIFSAGLTVSAGQTTIDGHALTLSAAASVGGTNTGDQTLPVGANPSATIGLSAVNGSAATFMTSDSAPALGVGIVPTWTAQHTFSNFGVYCSVESAPGFVLNASGADLGYVANTGANTWALGYGTSFTALGGSVLTWTNAGGVQIGAPTGGDKGAGTLNVSGALYINNAAVPAPVSGTFTGTLTGCTTSPTGTCVYAISGNLCTLFVAAVTGTSNTTAMTITGLPAACQPARTQLLMPPLDSCENSGAVVGTISMEVTASSGTITFLLGNSTTGFGNTLVKGVATGFTVAYLLN